MATTHDNRGGGAGAGELVLVGVDDVSLPLVVGTAVTGIPDRRPNGVVLDLGAAWYGHEDAAERLLTDSSRVTPDASAASQILRSYIDDVASGYYGRQATNEEIDTSLREDPSIDLALPSGMILVARQRDVVLGYAGLRLLPER